MVNHNKKINKRLKKIERSLVDIKEDDTKIYDWALGVYAVFWGYWFTTFLEGVTGFSVMEGFDSRGQWAIWVPVIGLALLMLSFTYYLAIMMDSLKTLVRNNRITTVWDNLESNIPFAIHALFFVTMIVIVGIVFNLGLVRTVMGIWSIIGCLILIFVITVVKWRRHHDR